MQSSLSAAARMAGIPNARPFRPTRKSAVSEKPAMRCQLILVRFDREARRTPLASDARGCEPRYAADPMKVLERSIGITYQVLCSVGANAASMSADSAAASKAHAIGDLGSRSEVTRPIASAGAGRAR